MNAAFFVLIDEIQLNKCPALSISESKNLNTISFIFIDDIFHDYRAAVLRVYSYLALLNLVIENFALVACHDCDAWLLAFADDVTRDCALEWTGENYGFDAIREYAVFDDDWSLFVPHGQDTDRVVLKIALTDGDFATFE